MQLHRSSDFYKAEDTAALGTGFLDVELLDYSYVDSPGYRLCLSSIKHIKATGNYRYSKVLEILLIWKQLMEYDDSIRRQDLVQRISPISNLRRVKFPTVEPSIKKRMQSIIPGYDWLPDKLDLDMDTVFRRDVATAKEFMKPKTVSDNIRPDHFVEAIQYTIAPMFNPSRIRLKSYSEYLEGMNKKSTAAYPTYAQKSDEGSIAYAEEFYNSFFGENDSIQRLFSHPSTVYHRFVNKVRSVSKTVDTKIRMVHGYPMGILSVQEAIHGDLIDDILSRYPYTVGLTRTQISEAINTMRRACAESNSRILSLDIESIDVRTAGDIQYLVHAILISQNHRYTNVYDKDKLIRKQFELAFYEVHGPMVGMWGHAVLTNGGTKSGTRMNTVTNSILLTLSSNYHYVAMGISLEVLMYLLQSDDGLLPLPAGDTLEKFKKDLKLFNQIVHPIKTLESGPIDPVDFLGFTWDIMGAPDRPKDWIMSKTIYPETFIATELYERFLIRASSILFQITSGVDVFEKILKKYYRDMFVTLKQGGDLRIPLFKSDNRTDKILVTIPLRLLLEHRWKLF